MNAQEVFDTVAVHLLDQGEPARRNAGGTGCAYRGVGGLKCAVGCLIPDEDYDAIIEGTVTGPCLFKATHPSTRELKMRELLTKLDLVQHLDLLRRLQFIHDDHDPDDWLNMLHETARKWELSSAALPKEP